MQKTAVFSSQNSPPITFSNTSHFSFPRENIIYSLDLFARPERGPGPRLLDSVMLNKYSIEKKFKNVEFYLIENLRLDDH